MPLGDKPFVGSEALANGLVRKHELRSRYDNVFPDVYVAKDAALTLHQRAVAGWLWSHREGIVAGLTAAALHGAKWVDDCEPVELICRNARRPLGLRTYDMRVCLDEYAELSGLPVTSRERTAFDLGRRGRLDDAIARLDALAAATHFKAPNVVELVRRHRHTRGLRQLEAALDLVDEGAASPKETWLRLLIIRAGYPRPQTQIPVLSPDGLRTYYLDMGWEDLKLAVEYEGDHHRLDPVQFAYDIRRRDDLHELGWTDIRVTKRHESADVLRRLRRAWAARTR